MRYGTAVSILVLDRSGVSDISVLLGMPGNQVTRQAVPGMFGWLKRMQHGEPVSSAIFGVNQTLIFIL